MGTVGGQMAAKLVREVVVGRKCIQEDCGGETIVVARVGTSGRRTLCCTRCHRQFAEDKGTPFFNCKAPIPKILQTLKAVIEGSGIRAAERMTGVHRDTVTKWLVKAGQHVEKVEEMMVKGLVVSQIQMDEMWTFIEKKTTIPIKRSEMSDDRSLKS